jgi:hypothetical protein
MHVSLRVMEWQSLSEPILAQTIPRSGAAR